MASEFEVKIKKLKNVNFSSVYRKLELKNQSIKMVSNALSDSSYKSIRSVLRKAVESNNAYIEDIKKMDSVLDQIVQQYESTENDILEKNGEGWSLDKLLFDVIGEAGIAGSGISAIGKSAIEIYQGFIEGKNSSIYKGLLGYGKEFVSIVGELADNAYKTVGCDWKEALFGNWKVGSALTDIAEKTSKYSNNNTFTGLLKNEIDEFLPGSSKTVGENMKVGAKWGGIVISGVTNGIDNFEEHGGMDNGRFWAETITETAVDFGVGALAAAGVGAAAVALGVSAPAVAVGAVAAGAVWAVDGVVKWATKTFGKEEKGLTELISDTVLDAGEKVVTGIGNAVSSLGNAIGTKWRLAFG